MLAHFLEEANLPTTQISLIREHTATINPPRALWVPFELGRPLGIPNDAAFQSTVLLACLRLFDEKEGPVLEDFGENVPSTPAREDQGGACPINFVQHTNFNRTVAEQLAIALREEILQLSPWYDLALNKHGRTTVGVSGIDPAELADFLCAFLEGLPANPREDITLTETLKLAVDDLKAFYSEAMAAQPGQPPTSSMLTKWFWHETTAAQVLYDIQDVCLHSNDDMMRLLGQLLLIPMRPEADKLAVV
ncbi:MAG: hypothetical protein KKB30_05020 [Proteobacteria bacterium]|nr:hypothetical protein [Pseudomonadota bacterium]MBU1714578.1 hypothetical protein [Pseudomonadota bacterium]